MPNLADLNAAKFTPDVLAALLAGYTDAARSAIRSEAETWLHGDYAAARRMYDQTRNWAATALDARLRHSNYWGYWHANNLLGCAAVREAARLAGDAWTAAPGAQWIANPAPADAAGHPLVLEGK
jgi:hypothetical protein